MDERGDQVGVVDFDRQFNEDVLVPQVGLLQPFDILALFTLLRI